MPRKELGTLYHEDGRIKEVNPHDGRKFSLKELQFLVGGFIEIVPGTGKNTPTTYCNEEGRLKGLALNVKASKRWGQNLVGPVLQVRRLEVDKQVKS